MIHSATPSLRLLRRAPSLLLRRYLSAATPPATSTSAAASTPASDPASFSTPTSASSAPPPLSFIDVAAASGAAALLGPFHPNPGRFDACLAGLHVDALRDGTALGSFVVDAELGNAYGTLHGGAISTLVDVFGTLALLSVDPTRGGVSVEMNTSFMSAAKEGERVVVEGTVLKYGRRMGFTEVVLRRERDNAEVARGRHTKAF